MIDTMRPINPNQEYVNEWKEMSNGLIAHRYALLCTSFVCYAVYDRIDGLMSHTHSSLTHQEPYGWLGDMTTRELTPELNALPAWTQERCKAVDLYLDGLKMIAEATVRAAFPADFAGEETTNQKKGDTTK